LALLFVPIAWQVESIYPWARAATGATTEELNFNHIWLNVPFWLARAAIFFVCWLTLAFILSAWSRAQDRTGQVTLPRRFRLLSAPGLVLYGITITFASVDWIMSLQPEFRSTMFGPLIASGQLVQAQAGAALLLGWLAGRAPYRDVISVEVLNDLGNLVFTFLVIWAYMSWFQFMLCWIANLPEEIIWYLPRASHGWQWVAWAIFVFHFAVPFFLLLMREIKRSTYLLSQVCALLVFMQLVSVYWQVLPAFGAPSLPGLWLNLAMPVGMGGVWFAYFLWRFEQNPPLPPYDVGRPEAEHLRHHDEMELRAEESSHGR
jgi:hypothetical protein